MSPSLDRTAVPVSGTSGTVPPCATPLCLLVASIGPRVGGAGTGDLDVLIGGGVTVVRDFFAAGLIDTAHVVQAPMLLGRGVRLWDGLEAVSSPSGVTHPTLTRR